MMQMEQFPLLGFTGELRGSERSVSTMLPVLRISDAPFSPSSYRWTTDNLRPVDGRALEEIEFLPEGTFEIFGGHVLWFVGADLLADVANQRGLTRLHAQLLLWPHEYEGFRWRVGTQGEFNEFIHTWTNEITPMLRRSLVDQGRMASGETEDLFRFYLSWNSIDTPDRMLLRAAFFQQSRDQVRVEAVIRQAAASPHFSSQSAFRRALHGYMSELRAQRFVVPAVPREVRSVMRGRVSTNSYSVEWTRGRHAQPLNSSLAGFWRNPAERPLNAYRGSVASRPGANRG